MPLPNNNGGRALPPRRRSNPLPVAPIPPIEEEGIFQTVDPYEDTVEEETYEYIPQQKQLKSKSDGLENELSERDEDRFIDKKNKKIIPTGGKKSKLKARDVDHRKNTMVGVKIARTFVYLAILGIMGLGIKNTFFPEQIYTKAEIEEISNLAIGRTGFPMEKGRAYAQEFIYYYLNSDNSTASQQILSKFYTGEVNGQTPAATREIGQGSLQRPVTIPTLVKEESPTPYTGLFTFTAFVTDSDGAVTNEDGKLTGHWVTFAVNVYYDAKTDGMSIYQSGPTLVPNYKIKVPETLPEEFKYGTGTEDTNISPEINSTLLGFIKGYGESSFENHSSVDQYIPKDPDVSLITGFDNTVKLEEGSMYYEAYPSANTPGLWKVDMTVTWINNQVSDENTGNKYKSRYLIDITKTAENKYLVTKIVPYIFIAKEE